MPIAWPLFAAAIHGFLSVAFGAFGAHGLKARLADLPPGEAQKILGWVDTASRYQMAHALALLALVALADRLDPRWASLSAHGFAWGALIFSGTLYAMALGAPRILGAVTPLGGLGLLLGWVCLGMAAAK